jgi:hypothetical protein
MNKFIDELSNKMYELYKVYESYALNETNRKIVIVLEKGNIISIYLYNMGNNDELLDDVHISFASKETNLYYAIALRLFVKTLGNVMIYKLSNDMYYNATHKRYLLYIVKNEKLKEMIDEIVVRQEQEVICYDTDIVRKTTESVKNKVYSRKILSEIDNRTRFTNEMLRKW